MGFKQIKWKLLSSIGWLNGIRKAPIRDGMITTGGLRLKEGPVLEDPVEVKFAPLSDKRFYDENFYEQFEGFLPSELDMVGPPLDQNAFGYCFDIFGEIGSRQFYDLLKSHRYESKSKHNLELGDIIAVFRIDPDFGPTTHAGIYLGDGLMRSRWGHESPLIEHPVDVLPHYCDHRDDSTGTFTGKIYYGNADCHEKVPVSVELAMKD